MLGTTPLPMNPFQQQELADGLHALTNYHALLEQHERLEAEIFMDQTEENRTKALCGTLSQFVHSIPTVDQTKLSDVVKSKLPVKHTSISHNFGELSRNSVRLVARLAERRRLRLKKKIDDNEADLKQFNEDYDEYIPPGRFIFKNQRDVANYNALRDDITYCSKKKEEYSLKLKEVDEILNAVVIDTLVDDETTEESSIDEQ